MNNARFLCWTINPAVNHTRALCVLDMMHFVREGLRDLTGPGKPNTEFRICENFVKATIFELVTSPMTAPVPKRMRNDPGNTVDIIADTFTATHQWATRGAPIGAFRCGSVTDALMERLGAINHPDVDQYSAGSLELAFNATFSNFARACTRITLMHAIPELLHQNGRAPTFPEAWDKARDELWVRRQGLQRDLLLFGALLGGEHLQRAVHHVGRQTCISDEGHLNFALAHFMTRDGISPGSWSCEFEGGLREDIEAAHKRLMGQV